MLNSLVSLGEIVEVFSGFAWKAASFNNEGNGVPVIRIQNVGQPNSGFVYWDEEYQDRFLINQGDVLLSLSGSFRLAVWDGPTGLLNQRVVKLTPKDNLDAGYFRHFMQTQLREIEAMGRHALVNNVSVADLKKIQLPLPPLPEQRRVAAILDKADALRAKRREAIAKLDQMLQSVFLEMFGDPVANPKGWPIKKSSDIYSEKPRIGTTKPATGEGHLVVRVGEIGSYNIDLERSSRVELDARSLEKCLLQPGDTVLARAIGSKDQLGKCSYFSGFDEPVCIDSHVMRLRTDPQKVESAWFYFLISSDSGKRMLQSKGGATAVQFNINAAQASDLDIPVPPLDLQKKFVSLMFLIRNQIKAHIEASHGISNLFASLQQQAFAGTQ